MKTCVGIRYVAAAMVALSTTLTMARAATTTVTDTACNSRLDVTVAATTRSSAVSASDCQERVLDSATGFSLAALSPTGATTPDSAAMVSAGGALYESFVAGAREAAVLLTSNKALMMSRAVSGDGSSVDWTLGMAVQPVSGATNAWLTGTYTLLRANREVRAVQATQTDAALSEIFDPVTLRITFDGNSGCSVASYSSWFSYSLTTDPAGAFSQPDGNDYGLHQAVYAGAGYAGQGGLHEDATRTFTDCDYVLGSDGKLYITYDYTDGDAVAHSVENTYFVSADLRYMVSTVDAASDLYRGMEVGVRVKSIAGTQDARNDAAAGSYLFNAPTLELQGATGVLTDPNNEHRNSEKVTQCMSRGSMVLSTTTSSTAGWNTCTWESTSTCSVRGEEGEAPSISLSYYTAQGEDVASSCRFQVASDGSVSFVVGLTTAAGAQSVTFNGAVSDNYDALVLRGKYVGSTMTDPHDTLAPERDIKTDLVLSALVGIKYSGTLTADADSDGLSNLAEFIYGAYAAGGVKNDFDADGDSDLLWRDSSSGSNVVWVMQNGTRSASNVLGSNATTYTIEGVADFDADGDDDVLFRNNTTGQSVIWTLQNGVKAGTSVLGTNAASYSVKGLADFDGDGDADIYFRDTSGNNLVWVIQGAIKTGASVLGANAAAFSVIGTKDADADGDADIYFRNNTTGQSVIWTMQNNAKIGTSVLGTNATTYTVKGVADFDNDGDADVLFRDTAGSNIVWKIQNSAKIASSVLGSNATSYSVAAVADFDADGDADVLFRDTTGANVVWIMQNAAKTGASVLGSNASTYSVAGTADFDGDGDEDVLFRNGSTGANVVWVMQNNAKSAANVLSTNAATMNASFEK